MTDKVVEVNLVLLVELRQLNMAVDCHEIDTYSVALEAIASNNGPSVGAGNESGSAGMALILR